MPVRVPLILPKRKQHTPDQLIPLRISLTPLVSCPKVGTFGYQDHQEKRYSTPDSGSHLRRIIDC